MEPPPATQRPRRVLRSGHTKHRGVVYPLAGWRVSNPRSDRPAAAEGRGFNSSGRGLAEQPAPIGPCRSPPLVLFSFVSLVKLTGRVCLSVAAEDVRPHAGWLHPLLIRVSPPSSAASYSSSFRPMLRFFSKYMNIIIYYYLKKSL